MTDTTQRTRLIVAAALLLALSAILVTRILKAFTVAEVLSVLAFLAGLSLLYFKPEPKNRPHTLIITGAIIGLSGIIVKVAFVALGIGEATDHSAHTGGAPSGSALLQHIHHLFFNAGFLTYLAAAIGLLIGRFKTN